MSLLLPDAELDNRTAVAGAELAPLSDGLTRELAPLLDRDLYIPREKALLSREGGRCPRDGATLEFDASSPHRHRCPACGETYTGDFHDRFWVFWYQLWLAERAVHGALLGRLRCDRGAHALAVRILERYCEAYLQYPNRDNVLGPTRLFFSTYLESIWLLNLSIAIDLVEHGEVEIGTLGARVRDRIIEPSAAIIASYDEGASNRQVWNDAALVAANLLLGRDAEVERALYGPSGIEYHLANGLLADGTWYEGENYHLFAHRGLWYGVTMAEAANAVLPRLLLARFQEGFATPFLTALPDMTLPSRRDSQYAISLRQPRFAELCELGLARQPDDGDHRLRAVLHHLYEDDVPRRDTGRAQTTADVERNLPGTALSRADLGWRSLLFARPTLPRLDATPLGTVLLEAQGLAVFRRAKERVYVALDYGASGGGHGHPDRLNLLLSDGDTRWLDDMGTGSYVDPSLHWYRSTLAHNAPLFNGCEQQRVDGELLAFEERGEYGWVSARALNLYPGVAAMRTVVVMADYVLDELAWHGSAPVVMDLPMHLDPDAIAVHPPASHEVTEPFDDFVDRLEDTLGFIEEVSVRGVRARAYAQLTASAGDRAVDAFVMPSSDARIFRVTAPGPPGAGRRAFLIARIASGQESGWLRTVWSWSAAVARLRTDPDHRVTIIERADGSHDHHRHTLGGWRVERVAGGLRTGVDLGGRARRQRSPTAARPTTKASPTLLVSGSTARMELGRDQYRRSEETWEEAGEPTARVDVRAVPNEVEIEIDVRKKGELTFVGADAINVYDNESSDINGDGVQLYVLDASGPSAWVLVPEHPATEHGTVRARRIDGWPVPRPLDATWQQTSEGYSMRIHVPLRLAPQPPRSFHLGLVVNERPPGRDRRRGQLVLGGRPGEFVYLRGDREDRTRLLRFLLTD